MTFDGSPNHTRHGVGGFPKLPEQRSRPDRSGARVVVIFVIGVAVLLAVALALAFAILTV